MKKYYFLTFITLFVLKIGTLNAQTIWTGPTTTFSKSNNADWTLEANQDRLTSVVWITRANNQGIFNINTETSYTDFSSPLDTEWAIGTTADIAGLTFQNWEDTSGSNPPSLVDQNLVVHLITDDIYIDIKFTSWQSGGAGGGFSYDRSSDQNLSANEFKVATEVEIFPNPSSEFIQVSGLTTKVDYTIYNVLGKEIRKGNISNEEQIDVDNLKNGLYFLKLHNRSTLKFMVKQ